MKSIETQLKLDLLHRCRSYVYQSFMDLVYTEYDELKDDLNNVFIKLGEEIAKIDVQK